MGRLNELLGAGAAYSKGVAIQFGQDEQEGVPTLAPELVPVSDIHQRPEQWALHGGTLLYGFVQVSAGGAGNHAQAAVEPAADSDGRATELVIVEEIIIIPSAAQIYSVHTSTTALGTSTGNLVARDARRIVTAGGSGASGTRIRTSNSIPAAGLNATLWTTGIAVLATEVGVPIHIPLDFVLVAPWSIRVIATTANTPLNTVMFKVRVRPGGPRELSIGNV